MSSKPETFDANSFIQLQTEEIKKTLGTDKAIIAVSGGVDSTTCAALTRRAIGKNLICVFIDTNFMRKGEPEKVKSHLAKPPLKLPLKIVKAQKRFMKNLEGLTDAEEKRKAFRHTFYSTLGDTAKKEKCKWLVQGTIAPDLIETKGGVKTQHNVLEQIGIDPKEKYGYKVVEPVASLYKPQVRILSRKLGFPKEMSERQPFPGPGLMVRCVGSVSQGKLQQLKTATEIIEKALKNYGAQQYFAAIIENNPYEEMETCGLSKDLSELLNLESEDLNISILENMATGVVEGKRIYGQMAGVTFSQAIKEEMDKIIMRLVAECPRLVKDNPNYIRLLLEIKRIEKRKPYAAIIRAISTDKFLTAQPLKIDWKKLASISSTIVKQCTKVSTVYYDLTPKPPATIEFE
ncbi:MAG: GMP synthase [Candidatus Bathyarchaeota archaeon]|nr:GMP synthase [Candidatus Bathyarchaeota archaeon]